VDLSAEKKKGLRQVLRDFVIALSLSNLWFFDVWRYFLISHPNSYPYYHWKPNPAPILLATMLDVLLLSTVFWVGISLIRHSRNRFLLKLARVLFLVVFFLTLIDFLMSTIYPSFRLLIDLMRGGEQLFFSSRWSKIAFLGLLVIEVVAAFLVTTILFHRLVFRRQQLIKLSTALLLICSPFVFITFAQAISQWASFRSADAFVDKSAQMEPHPKVGGRVVWLIFDEMDFRLSFVDRPSAVQLPAFDQLRDQAVFADNAYPPGGATDLSLPSLITGRLISWNHRTAPNEMMLTFADNNERAGWSTQPNVFSKARAMGFNTALDGWYHPYCRIIGDSLTRCYWESPGIRFLPDKDVATLLTHSSQVSVSDSMLRIGEAALIPEPVRVLTAPWEGNTWRRFTIENFTNIHREALTLVTDPRLDLIFIHYPIPHPPGIYDKSSHDFSLSSTSGYLDSLELADRTLAELQRAMEKAGLWDATTLIVSSDHRLRADRLWQHHVMWSPSFTKEDVAVFNRTDDERVPFILKLPHETKGLEYQAPFNTVLTSDLVLAILKGDISGEADVGKWLDQHRSIGQSPYLDGEN
jgi:hypothetical protein